MPRWLLQTIGDRDLAFDFGTEARGVLPVVLTWSPAENVCLTVGLAQEPLGTFTLGNLDPDYLAHETVSWNVRLGGTPVSITSQWLIVCNTLFAGG